MSIYRDGLICYAAAYYILTHAGQAGAVSFASWTALHAFVLYNATLAYREARRNQDAKRKDKP